jgi:hypothetical protein
MRYITPAPPTYCASQPIGTCAVAMEMSAFAAPVPVAPHWKFRSSVSAVLPSK